MRLRRLCVVRFMGSVFRTERVAGLPSLCGKDLVTESLGVTRPVVILGVVGDLRAAKECQYFLECWRLISRAGRLRTSSAVRDPS